MLLMYPVPWGFVMHSPCDVQKQTSSGVTQERLWCGHCLQDPRSDPGSSVRCDMLVHNQLSHAIMKLITNAAEVKDGFNSWPDL